jgi:hypothetical protein
MSSYNVVSDNVLNNNSSEQMGQIFTQSTQELATELATQELATELATQELATQELATQELATQNVINEPVINESNLAPLQIPEEDLLPPPPPRMRRENSVINWPDKSTYNMSNTTFDPPTQSFDPNPFDPTSFVPTSFDPPKKRQYFIQSFDQGLNPFDMEDTADHANKIHHSVVKSMDLTKELPKHDNTEPMDSTIILDETGSMESMGNEPKQSVRQYIEVQKESGFKVRCRIIRFAEYIKVMEKDIDDPTLNADDFKPDGMTALIDAVIYAILTATKPQHVNIITDGKDNSSVYKIGTLNTLIKRAEEAGWTFTFIGCTQDACEQGTQFQMSSQPINISDIEGAPPPPSLFDIMGQVSRQTSDKNQSYSSRQEDEDQDEEDEDQDEDQEIEPNSEPDLAD